MRRHRGMGWGPPHNRPVIIHRHGYRRRVGGGGFVGGLVGGVIGGIIGSSSNKESRESERDYLPSYLEEIVERVTEVPEGATVYLKIEEFRALTDKNMVTYQDTVPYCMGRKIEVQ